MCGYTPQTSTKYTGMQAVTAPSSGRHIWQSSAGADESLTSASTFTLSMLDKAKEAALTATPMIRPINVRARGSDVGDYDDLTEAKFVVYLHPYQVTDLRTSTSTGQWLDLQKAAMMGGQITKNPIYSGAYH